MTEITLRPLAGEDAAWADGWLPSVAEGAGHDATDAARLLARARRERSLRVLAIERDGAPLGVLLCALDRRGRTATIELVALAPKHARYGAGMRAAALAEADLRAAGARRIYAAATERHGISLYFWIRLGFRPLARDEWPCARAGTAWLSRE